MIRYKKSIGIFFTVAISILFLGIYLLLEDYYYSDFGCGCSSGCIGFYFPTYARWIGYFLLIGSGLTFIAACWSFKGISRIYMLPALFVFTTGLYGNGYLIYNKGACGLSLNQTRFFVFQKTLGDFAKADGETVKMEELNKHTYDGKLLGFYLKDHLLTVYRIGAEPLLVQTGFLFWQANETEIKANLYYGLNTYCEPPNSSNVNRIELIGGKDMPIEAFKEELKYTNNWGMGNVKKEELIQSADGTTRYIFYQ